MSGSFVAPVIPDKHVKFRDNRLQSSRGILPEAVGGDIFDGLVRYKFGTEAVSDGICGVDVEQLGRDVHAK